MSKINRIRIMNLNYNGNSIRIDDETFELGGESTLLSLRNGGGKTVLVQMVMSLFVNKAYRDFEDRPFKSYFTTNRPTFLMTEWALDYGQGYFLAGMMVRKAQNTEENNNEELELLTFTGSYRQACDYDIEHLPVTEENERGRVLKGFGACRKEFEELKKSRGSDFNYYDMSSAYQRRQYFTKLKEYQINHKEWESIIKKVNLKESGLSELFTNAKDEKGLTERWLLDAVESKLNQGNSRIKEFQSLAAKLIRQYRENQSKLLRREIIGQYFTDAAELEKQIEGYMGAEEALVRQKSEIAAFIRALSVFTEQLGKELEAGRQRIAALEGQLRDIEHEKRSFEIWQLEDEKKENLQKRIASELWINQSEYARAEAEKELCRYQCAQLYAEAEDFRKRLSGLQAKLSVLLEQQKDSEGERRRLGGSLYHYYESRAQQYTAEIEEKNRQLEDTGNRKRENSASYDREIGITRELSGKIGGLVARIGEYDRAEQKFTGRYKTELVRNILGEYEEGVLALCEKKFQEELVGLQTEMVRLSEQLLSLKKEEDRLNAESEELKVEGEKCRGRLAELDRACQSMEKERERRKSIMRYVEAPEKELDDKELLLCRLDNRIEGLEEERAECQEKQRQLAKEHESLSQGRIVELPENIAEYFEEQGIEYIYGMEWLKKNGRDTAKNQKLTEENPLLPYSIIVAGSSLKKLSVTEREIYTSFPIPIIVREQLEEKLELSENGLLSFGAVSFFVMFNRHLLNPEELAALLREKKQQEELWQEREEIKKKEIQEYRGYRNETESQTYTESLLKENTKQAEECRKRRESLLKAYDDCGENKKKNRQDQEDCQRRLGEIKDRKQAAERRNEDFADLLSSYESYLSDRAERERLIKKEKEAKEKAARLKEEGRRLDEKLLYIKDVRKSLGNELSSCQERISLYHSYKEEPQSAEKEADYAALEARYRAITEGISSSIEDLNRDLREENKRLENKTKELQKKNKYDFSEDEYAGFLYSEDMAEHLEEQIKAAVREENDAKEENKRLENQIARLDTRLEYAAKHMAEKTGYTELKPRELITGTDFDGRLKLAGYECDKQRAAMGKLAGRLEACQSTQAAMAEYTDFTIACEVEERELSKLSKEELNNCQGRLRRDLRRYTEEREEQRRLTEGLLRELALKDCYQDDFFKKGFDNLLTLVNRVPDLREQLRTLLSSYDSIQKKLEVDLENIGKERKNVEEILLDYVKDIDDNMRQIDKNSSISVRGRSLRMLKISVPDWEENRELYQKRIQDFTETFLKWGMEAAEKNQNVDELLGKLITTKKLYDDVVNIRNIGIRLYKIEAEREVPISWAEVSANSGGEGFLSAFVILSSLLSYMRRDETDLFAAGEEGKVLIMDNPFAQTNAVHLLKPLMDMARKTNTQLICLSGLGGDSIYNRFDNIYVLNVVNSSRGMRYLKSEHIKGEDSKEMVLSQFRTEQMRLFDMETVEE